MAEPECVLSNRSVRELPVRFQRVQPVTGREDGVAGDDGRMVARHADVERLSCLPRVGVDRVESPAAVGVHRAVRDGDTTLCEPTDFGGPRDARPCRVDCVEEPVERPDEHLSTCERRRRLAFRREVDSPVAVAVRVERAHVPLTADEQRLAVCVQRRRHVRADVDLGRPAFLTRFGVDHVDALVAVREGDRPRIDGRRGPDVPLSVRGSDGPLLLAALDVECSKRVGDVIERAVNDDWL